MATVNIPSGVKAYILNSCDGTTATWNEITDKIPAFTGVLLVGEGGTHYDFYCPSGSNTAIDGIVATGPTSAWYSTAATQQNILVGTYESTAIPASNETTSYYGLIKNSNKFGRVTADVNIGAGMAYFSAATPAGGSAREFVLNFDGDDVTAINGVTALDNDAETVYNLNGMRVTNPTKGLYIVNGKKVIIK